MPGALSSIAIGCLETHNALGRHFLDDVKADTNQIAERKSRWHCGARVIHSRFARDEVINFYFLVLVLMIIMTSLFWFLS